MVILKMYYIKIKSKKGEKMKRGNLGLMIVIILIVIIGISLISGYNGLITKQENVQNAYSNLDVMLQRRADLIPNLVSTVKGYTEHENEVIEKITDARAKLVSADSIAEKSQANEELTTSLNALMLVVENYPDLKSSQNFIQLSDELAGTENRIAVARKDYNDVVKSFNTSVKRFPNNVLSGLFGFEQIEYFQASEGSAEVPSVSFE